jgi:hypothetical protein
MPELSYNETILLRTKYSKKPSPKKIYRGLAEFTLSLTLIFSEQHHNMHFYLSMTCTTGATLEACSRPLLKIPGAKN